jgi:hypothetical protein
VERTKVATFAPLGPEIPRSQKCVAEIAVKESGEKPEGTAVPLGVDEACVVTVVFVGAFVVVVVVVAFDEVLAHPARTTALRTTPSTDNTFTGLFDIILLDYFLRTRHFF